MPTLSPPIYPVEATFDGHDFVSTGLDYSDLTSMHSFQHKPFAGRRLETPTWAANNSQLLEIVVLYMEKLCLGRHQLSRGTLQQRLAKAIEKRLARRPKYTATLDKLCKLYVSEQNPARRKELATEIKCLDAVLRHLGREHLNAIGVVRRYWLLGEDSVAVANELGMSPMHVRVLLGRLKDVAKNELWKPRLSCRINLLRGLKSNPIRVPAYAPRAPKEKQCWVCGIFFTSERAHQNNKNLCSLSCRKKRQAVREKNKRIGLAPPPKYFCGPACREIGKRTTLHAMPLLAKPGIGKWWPQDEKNPYQNYAAYCRVIGTDPIPETAWRMERQ